MAPGLTNLGLQGTLQTWFDDVSLYHVRFHVFLEQWFHVRKSLDQPGAPLLRNSTPSPSPQGQSHGFPIQGVPDRQEPLGWDSSSTCGWSKCVTGSCESGETLFFLSVSYQLTWFSSTDRINGIAGQSMAGQSGQFLDYN